MTEQALKRKFKKNNLAMFIMKIVFIILFIVGIIISAYTVIDCLMEKSRLEDLGATVTLKITGTFIFLLAAIVISGIAGIGISIDYNKKEKAFITNNLDEKTDVYKTPISTTTVEYDYSAEQEETESVDNSETYLSHNVAVYNKEPIYDRTATVKVAKVKPTETKAPSTGVKLKSTMGKSTVIGSAVSEVTIKLNDKTDSTEEFNSGFFTPGDDL